MIPDFPKFKNISPQDREVIHSYTKDFLPYSDYNFNSLWSWDTTRELGFSDLNGNLVLIMPDYLTGRKVISCKGINRPKETVDTLLEHTKKHQLGEGLTLVPEDVVKHLSAKEYRIEEERHNFDYIFSTTNLSELKGRKFKAKRHLAKKFLTKHPTARYVAKPLSDATSRHQVLQVLETWSAGKQATELEHTAITRLLELTKLDGNELILSGLYLDDELIAFSIDEVLDNTYAISHFYKLQHQYKGVSEYLNQQTATFLSQHGVELWSWEQDLGIKGLRESKMSYRPVQFLKKYKITKA